ncbi:zinc finger MYM-type protein 1-like [Hetaerina americana]|uniref:zinc finger MYM-type protein 1-like n=1 Tax=Hetaerina americana TaxID=62018 RepID=UPI003A7F4A77
MARAPSASSSAKTAAQLSEDCDCIIEELMKKKFSQRDTAEKLRFVERGRPTPELPGLYLVCSDRERKYRRRFCVSAYAKHKWLTGCPKLNKLFCWPCVLFSREKSIWSREGLGSISGLSHTLIKHEKSRNHIQCAFALCTFGSPAVDAQLEIQKARSVTKHNDAVKNNRAILARLIDVACLLATQKIPFRNPAPELQEPTNKGNYVEVVNFLGGYDHLLKEHLKYSTVFRGTSPSTQNELIEAVGLRMMDVIKREVSGAHFVAILLDECSDSTHRSQISTVLRYVDGSGELQERFIGFKDVGADASAEAIYKHVLWAAKEFQLKGKLVAQTYDGASVHPRKLWALHTKVKDNFPQSLLVHYHSHVLNSVLRASAGAYIKECRLFFLSLTGLSNFFTKSPKRMEYLRTFAKKRLPNLATARWNFTTKLVNTVNEHRNTLILFLEHAVGADSEGEWDSAAVMQAQGSLLFLRQFETIFLLRTFSTIFAHADALSFMFQNKSKDVAHCHKKVSEAVNNLVEIRRVGFAKVWEGVAEHFGGAKAGSKYAQEGEMLEETYSKLFDEILEHAIIHISYRFSSLPSFHFMSLLDSSKFASYKGHFPDGLINNLTDSYGSAFDSSALTNELSVLYSSQEEDIFGESVSEIIASMNSKDLIWAMPELYKLACLISTLPLAVPSVDRSICAFKRIKAYCHSTEEQERMGPISLISIEKKLLCKLRSDSQSKFDDEVIDLFANRTRKSEFIFR